MKLKARIAIALLTLLVLAAIFKPSRDRHTQALQQTGKQEAGIFGEGLRVVQGAVSDYHDYVFFSTLTTGDETASLGVFGMVFVIKDKK